jgi:hypothetical protein
MLTNSSMRYDASKIAAVSNQSVVDDGEMIRTLGQLTDAEKNRVLSRRRADYIVLSKGIL